MSLNRTLSIAPMLDCTDRHFRYFLRLISRRVMLYTEMVTTGALLHGDPARHLAFDPLEHPLALQLGGSQPSELAACAKIAEDHGFDEVNLNVGCPSDRVLDGRFGACLMAEPQRVAECVGAMGRCIGVPITVKTRIGIDDRDRYEDLVNFVATVAAAGCTTFIIHARKAWLQGLSPKENREVPPLRYDLVRRLKQDFPRFEIILNGGVVSLDQAEAELLTVDGVMIGRQAYQDPFFMAEADGRFFADAHVVPTRGEVIEAFVPYVRSQLAKGQKLHHMTRHILGLYHGEPGARHWRRFLTENSRMAGADERLLTDAAVLISTAGAGN